MGSRKHSRPNSTVEVPAHTHLHVFAGQAAQEALPPSIDEIAEHIQSDLITVSSSTKSPRQDASSIKCNPRLSWYAGSSWPQIQKASPSTQVARETILADKPKNAPSSVDLSRFEPKKVEVTPSSQRSSSLNDRDIEDRQLILADASSQADRFTIPGASPNTSSKNGNTSKLGSVGAQRHVTASGWLGWFGLANIEQEAHIKPRPSQATSTSNDTSFGESPKQQNLQTLIADDVLSKQTTSSKSEGSNITVLPVLSNSWFNIWSDTDSNRKATKITPAENRSASPAAEVSVDEALTRSESNRPLPGTTWAFWSKDSQIQAQKDGEVEEPGELAVTGGASQNNPIPAHATVLGESKDEKASKTNKRDRELIDDAQGSASKTLHSDLSDKNQTPQKVAASTADSPFKADLSQTLTQPVSQLNNLLLPSFKSTYYLVETPSIIKQITQLLMRNHQTPANHVYLAKDLPKIKKALAIGIHGLFPAAFLRSVIGQPTGTSIRFANHAAAAVHRWASAHGYDCDVEKVALEGEGKIAERVDNLWKLLLNWIDHVQNADLIIIACHSQGVPVALMLVAKLIEFGVATTTRIGVCAMAGVSLGPFADYKSRLLTGSAAELFEFASQNSEVSKRYESSLRIALKYGVRVCYFGSIDDQLVSLESAVFSPINHPYIYRAVFVDGRVHAPDFIAHLVGFTLKLRNLGITDHGLIRELSLPLAGSLYTGEGHSRLYDEVKIYDDAVSFTLETTSVGEVPLQVQKFQSPTSVNPFQLPWSMRGLLEEDIVKTELDQETAELLKQFDEWKPTTKVLKDVKYRLEAVKSKL